ncbi:MAG: hypothetical protein Q9220_003341 [cf. Caloplaca sp. 1 TL-2023]
MLGTTFSTLSLVILHTLHQPSSCYPQQDRPTLQTNSSSSQPSIPLNPAPSASELIAAVVTCSAQRYNDIVIKSRCLEALATLPSNPNPRTYGARGQTSFDVVLPQRYLSNDGRCAIDVNNVPRFGMGDVATDVQVKGAAESIVEKCVIRTGPQRSGEPVGGRRGGVGTNGNLVVSVHAYKPSVMCTPGRIPDPSKCKDLLDRLFVYTNWTRFGKAHAPRINWLIPPGGLKYRDRKLHLFTLFMSSDICF